MSSDFKGKQKGSLRHSFAFAIAGIFHTIKHERNMKIHLAAAVFVIILGCIFGISALEWMYIAMVIGGMFSLELINTAVERVVDLVTSDFYPLAKQAKDAAAGAVFIYAILSVIIGCIIFLPKIF